jgi:hypothetical protein
MPRPPSEATKIAMMAPSERRKYEASKENKRKALEAAERFMCSVVLTREGHDLLKEYALHTGLTYPAAIEKAIKHCMGCFAEVKGEGEE